MRRLVPAGLLPVLLAIPGIAQETSTVTEAEFLSALDRQHPAVVASAEALAVARARVLAASTLENPVLGVAREDPSGPTAEMEWTLSWQLPAASRRPAIAAREEAVEAAAARRTHELRALRLAMRAVYAEWALAAARHARLLAQSERVEALAAREALRAERGEVSGLAAHRLALAATALRARLALTAAAVEEARARAAGWAPASTADARPVLPPLPPSLPSQSLEHPLISAAQADLAAATLERQAAGRFVATPELSVGWKREEAGAASVDGPVLGLAWALPIAARNRAEKAISEARVAGARARLERVRREIDAEREAARLAYGRLAAAVAAAETDRAANTRMLAGAEAAFRHGETGLTDFLDTQRSVTESELATLELYEAALAAHRELERLAPPDAPPSEPFDLSHLPDLSDPPSQEHAP